MTSEQQFDELLLQAFMAGEADAAAADAPTLDDVVARVAARLAPDRSPSRGTVVLLAATLLLTAALASAIAIGSGVIRLPWVREPALPAAQQTVAYAVGPSVMVGDVTTGEQHALVSAPGMVDVLAYSPDGERIAYTVSPGDMAWTLWVVDADGGVPREVATGLRQPQFEWSSDGSRLAAPTSMGVLLIDEAGLQKTVRLHAPIESVLEVHWHPNSAVVYAVNATGGAVWAVPLDGSEPTNVLPREAGLQARTNLPATVAISPDGRYMAVSRPEGIRVVDLATGDVRTRAFDGYVTHPVFSPDGRWLAVTSGTADASEAWISIAAPNADPATARRVGPRIAADGRLIATFSPDSTQLLIVSAPGSDGSASLVDVATGATHTLNWPEPTTPFVSWPHGP